MTLATHAVVGAAAASFFPSEPYLAFAVGFASHLAIDALPHYDYGEYMRSFVNTDKKIATDMRWGKDFWHDLMLIGTDALVGFVLTFGVAWILRMPLEIALIGAGAGIYPDLLQFLYFKVRGTPAEHGLSYLQRFHIWVQEGKDRTEWGWKKGFLLQALLVVVVLTIAAVH